MLQATQASLISYKDYKVGPEDQLAIVMFGQDKPNREIRVNGQGEISMPVVLVKVASLSPQDIGKRLEQLYEALFLVNPQINGDVKEFSHQRVAVTGAVAKPGSYEIVVPAPCWKCYPLPGGFE